MRLTGGAVRCAAASETVATGPAMAAGAAATAAAATAADRAPPLLRSVVSAPASAGAGASAAQPARGAPRVAVQLPSPTDATRQAGSSHPQQPSIFTFNQGATPPAVPSLGLLPSTISGSGAKAGAAGGLVETPVGSPMPAHPLSSTQPSPILAGFDPMSPAAPHLASSLAGGAHNPAVGGSSNGGAAPSTAAAGLMLPPPSAVVGTDWSAALPGRATAKGLSGGPLARGGEELPPAQYLEALVNR